MWNEGDSLDPELAINYRDFMDERGLVAVWTNLREINIMES